VRIIEAQLTITSHVNNSRQALSRSLTVEPHITDILNKLGPQLQDQISRWMAELNGPGLSAAEDSHSHLRVRLREPGLDAMPLSLS
jgi:hypothetical protein